jgi:hypothetical protein
MIPTFMVRTMSWFQLVTMVRWYFGIMELHMNSSAPILLDNLALWNLKQAFSPVALTKQVKQIFSLRR